MRKHKYYEKPARKAMECPKCGHEMGFIGRKTYFCSECFVEVNISKNGTKIGAPDINGNLRAIT